MSAVCFLGLLLGLSSPALAMQPRREMSDPLSDPVFNFLRTMLGQQNVAHENVAHENVAHEPDLEVDPLRLNIRTQINALKVKQNDLNRKYNQLVDGI